CRRCRSAVCEGAVPGGEGLLPAVEPNVVLLQKRVDPSAGRIAEIALLLIPQVTHAARGEALDRLRLGSLDFENALLGARASHRVVAEVAVAADHAVAGDQDRDRVLRQRRARGAPGGGGAGVSRAPSVGPHLAAWDLERLPQDGLLELRQTRQVET